MCSPDGSVYSAVQICFAKTFARGSHHVTSHTMLFVENSNQHRCIIYHASKRIHTLRLNAKSQYATQPQSNKIMCLHLFYRTDYTDSRTMLNGCTGKCVRLSRPLVGFWTHFKSPHFHFISFQRLGANKTSMDNIRCWLAGYTNCGLYADKCTKKISPVAVITRRVLTSANINLVQIRLPKSSGDFLFNDSSRISFSGRWDQCFYCAA